MADDQSGTLGYKVLATLSAVLGAFVARKLLTFVWEKATGHQPPANPEHPSVTWPEAVAWAGLSGAVVGVARLIAQRRVAATWNRPTGSLPPDLEQTAA
jgi:hypothetical protein